MTPGGNTWAEDNPEIESAVLAAIKDLTATLDYMMSTNAEGMPILDGLLTAGEHILKAIESYYQER